MSTKSVSAFCEFWISNIHTLYHPAKSLFSSVRKIPESMREPGDAEYELMPSVRHYKGLSDWQCNLLDMDIIIDKTGSVGRSVIGAWAWHCHDDDKAFGSLRDKFGPGFSRSKYQHELSKATSIIFSEVRSLM